MWRVCESSNSSNVAALKVVDVPTLLSTGVDSVQLEKGGTDDESTMISETAMLMNTRPSQRRFCTSLAYLAKYSLQEASRISLCPAR